MATRQDNAREYVKQSQSNGKLTAEQASTLLAILAQLDSPRR